MGCIPNSSTDNVLIRSNKTFDEKSKILYSK